MIQVYKKYDIFLNVNTVKDSPTMFSRRVFELLACGVNVISNYSLGISDFFPDIVRLCTTEKEVGEYLAALAGNKDLRDKLSLLGQRKVFMHHTYGRRLQTILETVGLHSSEPEFCGVSIIAILTSTDSFKNIWANYNRQSYPKKELILILPNSFPELANEFEELLERNDVMLMEFDGSTALTDCFILAIEQARFDYIAWFGTTDYYGAEFLTDLINAFQYTDASVVGKYTHYNYSSKTKSLDLQFPGSEYGYVDCLLGNALIAKREIAMDGKLIELVSLTEKELCLYHDPNIKMFAADRFNYICHYLPMTGKTILHQTVCI
jgi:hypothetical protein